MCVSDLNKHKSKRKGISLVSEKQIEEEKKSFHPSLTTCCSGNNIFNGKRMPKDDDDDENDIRIRSVIHPIPLSFDSCPQHHDARKMLSITLSAVKREKNKPSSYWISRTSTFGSWFGL